MFFAPVLAVVAATGISSTYAAAIPAVTQQVSNSAAINLEDYLTDEQKQAGLGGLVKSMGPTILGLVTSFIPGMFAGGKDQKRDLEGLEELMRRSLDGLSEEEKQAKFSAILKGIAPALAGVAASFLPGLFSSGQQKRDLEGFEELMRRSFDGLSEEEKQARFSAIIKGIAPALAGVAASFLPGLFSSGQQKRDVADIDSMNDEEKKAFWGALAGVAASLLGGVIGGKRDVDINTMDDEEKKAFWGALAGVAASLLGGVFGGKRDVVDVDSMNDEEKKAFWGALAGVAASFLGGVLGKRDVDINAMDDEEKKAFWGALASVAASLLGGVIGGKRDVDINTMDDEEKKAFWGALAGVAASLLGGVFGGKRDVVDVDSMNDEEKKAFWGALAGVAASFLGGVLGKRDVDLSEEDKQAFIPALIGVLGSVFGGLVGGRKRDVDINTMDDEEKKAFWGALAGVAASFLGGILGKRDVELSEEDKQAFIPALIGVLGSVFGGLVGGRKRDLDFDSLDAETKQAVIINLLSEFAPQAKQAMRRDAAEILYARDAGFADAFFAEEF